MRYVLASASVIVFVGLIAWPATLFGLEWQNTSIIVRFSDSKGPAFPQAKDNNWIINKDSYCVFSDISSLNQQYNMVYGRPLWRGSYAAVKNIYRLDFSEGANMDLIKATYDSSPNVSKTYANSGLRLINDPVIAHPNDFWYNYTFTPEPPGDPLDTSHSICDSLGFPFRLWHLTKGNFHRAWPITTGSPDVIVAILDSGLDITHPEFANLIYYNDAELFGNPYVDEDINGYDDDWCGYDFGENDNDVQHDTRMWQDLNCPGDYFPLYPDLDTCYCCIGKLIYHDDIAIATCDNMDFDWGVCPPRDGLGVERHGTVMAGIISAASNNRTTPDHAGDITGINWHTKILPLKGGTKYATGSADLSGNLSDALEAINYLIDFQQRHNADIRVLNMSMTFDDTGSLWFNTSLFDTLFIRCRELDILPVGGAGNWGDCSNPDSEAICVPFPVYPCRDPNVFCATCLDSVNVKLNTAQCGTDSTDNNDESFEGVDVCAFGTRSGINSEEQPQLMALGWEPWNHPLWSFCGNGTELDTFTNPAEWHISGITPMLTSGATAQVSGLAALVSSVYPNLHVDDVEKMILRGAVSVDALNGSYAGRLGLGRIDAYRTLTLWGTVYNDTTLSTDSWISGNVLVMEGATLTIPAGAHILVAPDNTFSDSSSTPPFIGIAGGLEILGTQANPVVIEGWSNNPSQGDWGGIWVMDDRSGDVIIQHAKIKNAVWGIFSASDDFIYVENTEIEECTIGAFLVFADANFTDCKFKYCTKGAYVWGGDVDFDGCHADYNVYGYYFEGDLGAVNIYGKSYASNNELAGIYCRGSMTIGPKVHAEGNGQNGIRVERFDLYDCDVVIDNVRMINHDQGSGLLVADADEVLVKNCDIRDNYDNVKVLDAIQVVLGDSAQQPPIGGDNRILDPTRYHVNNFRNPELKAELCYWGPTSGGQMPTINVLGPVDIRPWLDDDPGFSWRMQQDGLQHRKNWVSGSYPNPFNPATRIDYVVERGNSYVELKIFDLRGRLIRTLVKEKRNAGTYTAIWNGRDEGGREVPSGMYFYHMRIGGAYEASGKLVLLK